MEEGNLVAVGTLAVGPGTPVGEEGTPVVEDTLVGEDRTPVGEEGTLFRAPGTLVGEEGTLEQEDWGTWGLREEVHLPRSKMEELPAC